MLLPALSGAKEAGKNASRASIKMRQLGLGEQMYADDNDDQFTPRQAPYWMTRLLPYYQDLKLLVCPTDIQQQPAAPGSAPDTAARSYVVNGWNDYFESVLSTGRLRRVHGHNRPSGMRPRPFASRPTPSPSAKSSPSSRTSTWISGTTTTPASSTKAAIRAAAGHPLRADPITPLLTAARGFSATDAQCRQSICGAVTINGAPTWCPGSPR